MSKKILIGLGIFALAVAALFATGVIELVSVEEAYQLQQKEKTMVAGLETKIDASVDRELGSMTIEDVMEITKNDKVKLADLDNIRNLVEDGQFQQALEAHLWFHEESKSSAAMTGVRLSFAISSWLELGKKYPPALTALIAVRDKQMELLLTGDGDFSNFLDFSSINRILDQNQDTIELFLTLDARAPNQSEMYYRAAEDLLMEAGHYGVVSKYIGDPIVKYENLRYMRESSLGFAKSSSMDHESFLLESADKEYIKGVLKLIEVCLAIDKKDSAIEIQKRALAYFDNDQISAALQ